MPTVPGARFYNAIQLGICLKLSKALHRVLCAPLQGAELEKQAEGIVVLESRIEVAEGERDAAREAMQAMTPRPGLPPGLALPSQLGPEGTAKFMAALTKHRWCWQLPACLWGAGHGSQKHLCRCAYSNQLAFVSSVKFHTQAGTHELCMSLHSHVSCNPLAAW